MDTVWWSTLRKQLQIKNEFIKHYENGYNFDERLINLLQKILRHYENDHFFYVALKKQTLKNNG